MKYIIDKDYDDVRLDRFLRNNLKELALTEIFKAIRTGKIKVNGKKSKQNYRLKEGDEIKIFLNLSPKSDITITREINDKEIKYIKNSIVYEDENILIFNKKPNEVMHKGSGHEYGISELIKGYLENPNFNFVNRIDRLTSGLVIGAKNLVTIRNLAAEIRDRNIVKKYYILVEGKILKNNFIIKSYLKKMEDKVIELDKFETGAKESISKFKVIKSNQKYTLLEGTLGTGRTHQLRVQLSNMGHPIVGDGKYGHKGEFMFLFSYYLNIPKYDIEIEMPLPTEFCKFI